MHAQNSKVVMACYANLALVNLKKGDENLTSFIYRWGELLLQSCCTIAEQNSDKLKIDLFLIIKWKDS